MRDNLQFQLQPFMLIAFLQAKIEKFSMTDSMNFGPDWIRNLSSEGSTGGGGAGGGTRYQLADHRSKSQEKDRNVCFVDFRYGREEMLALFDKNLKPPPSLTNFKSLYSEPCLPPLTLLPTSEEEVGRGWQARPASLLGQPRGRGGSLERGSRTARGRGAYPSYGRPSGYDGGWGNGEQPEWSPRKEYQPRGGSDNWRRARNSEEDDGWRSVNSAGRGGNDKWGRQSSWRGDGDADERPGGPPDRRSWHEGPRDAPPRRSWDGGEDRLPEWANEAPGEGGGSFDERGAFHGSDEEQVDRRSPVKREGIQKSTSQQHIANKAHPPLPMSKSTISLVNKLGDDDDKINKEELKEKERFKDNPLLDTEKARAEPKILDRPEQTDQPKVEPPPKPNEKSDNIPNLNNGPTASNSARFRVEDRDFEKLQEDFVLKLVVDEEPPKQQNPPPPPAYDMSALQPPPNLAPIYDRWFYQDPQGQMQGPFANVEMSEWYKAGYFSHQLKVRRQCDERYFLLGELINMCGGSNPFQSNVRFPILKNDITKMPTPDVLQFQYLSQMAAYKQAQARIMAEPWSALTLQQQEIAAQRLIMQQQQQVPQDLQYMQQQQTNPLMHMISQMQQANKLPGPSIVEKPPQNIPGSLDPHMQLHMGNLLSMQNRLPGGAGGGIPNHLPNPSMPPENIPGNLTPANMSMPGGMGGLGLSVPRPTSVDHVDNDPISSLLKQLQQQKQESMWQQSQFQNVPAPAPQHQQWQVQQEVPMSMWDMQQGGSAPSPKPQEVPQAQAQAQVQQPQAQKPEKEPKKDETKEVKKKKENDEKQVKKDAEEKRKQEQRKLEIERKVAEEKKKKEEEKIRKELEKAKREAEEKRLRELEEKRKLKEQRKAEDEARRKQEEIRKQEEERMRREKDEREAEERQKAEEKRQEQIRLAKAAPWSQSNSTMGTSLAEIQKAEREKRAQDAALQLQRQQIEKEMQQLQQQQEKPGGMQLSWANRPIEPKKVKSLAEIQAEEQERLAKEAAEARHRKEKEAREVPQVQNVVGSIWSSQSLTWVAAGTQVAAHGAAIGFWDDQPTGVRQQAAAATKPSTTPKNSSSKQQESSKPAAAKHQPAKQPQQPKKKKEEKVNNNNNGPQVDEFTGWCYRTLSNISTDVDVPTFVAFLRDIESALDVREYCKEYLGEGQATSQFAGQFLEKRRQCRPTRADPHKDDMCAPAPAVNPGGADFQEVKGKNKKNKKSKMQKVDSRILGFNVTSAPDRINVGDRDYGDNS